MIVFPWFEFLLAIFTLLVCVACWIHVWKWKESRIRRKTGLEQEGREKKEKSAHLMPIRVMPSHYTHCLVPLLVWYEFQHKGWKNEFLPLCIIGMALRVRACLERLQAFLRVKDWGNEQGITRNMKVHTRNEAQKVRKLKTCLFNTEIHILKARELRF